MLRVTLIKHHLPTEIHQIKSLHYYFLYLPFKYLRRTFMSSLFQAKHPYFLQTFFIQQFLKPSQGSVPIPKCIPVCHCPSEMG